ncbi:hypothetical protein PsP108CL_16860 [Pseudomonas syringae]|nr:hypothetical protein [Pseudomonas syringae]
MIPGPSFLRLIIVPMLRVGMPFWTLCVLPITARQACAGFPAIHASGNRRLASRTTAAHCG